MKKLLWLILKLVDNNWGYTTPTQERFKAGDKCKIHFCYENNGFSPGETVVENESGLKECVFQFELYK